MLFSIAGNLSFVLMDQSHEVQLVVQVDGEEGSLRQYNDCHTHAATNSQLSPPASHSGADERPDVPPNYIRFVQSGFAPPPTYESLFGKVRKLQNDSLERAGCGDKVYSALCSALMIAAGLLIFVGFPFAMLVIGLIYMNECNSQKMVPIYLVVSGCTTVIYLVLRKVYKKCSSWRKSGAGSGDEPKEKSTSDLLCNMCDGLFTLFMISWFLAGNFYIYSTWVGRPSCPSSTIWCELMKEYCHPVLLLFAFWSITATYAMCGCCACFCMSFGCIAACSKG